VEMMLRIVFALVALQLSVSLASVKEVTLNTGFKIPLIGLGTYMINGTEKTNQIVDEALAAGYRLFDTAHLYKNEEFLGQAFKELLPKHNLTRKDIYITTKIVPSTKYKTEADYEALVRQSLTNFQTTYIDLFLIHWPGVIDLPKTSPEVITYRHGAWKALSKFQSDGHIRSIGVSNFMVKHLEALRNASSVVPAVNQVEWHPQLHEDKLLNYCRDNNILFQAYSSLGSSKHTSLRLNPTVASIATKLDKSPSQVLLRWAYQNDIAIIPKASSRKHLVENISLDFTIPAEEMALLDGFEQTFRAAWDPNTVI